MVLKLAGGLGEGVGGGGMELEHRLLCGLESLGSHFHFLLDVSPAEKPGLTERKGGLGVPSRDRNTGAAGQDIPGVSLHPLSGDSPDREPGEFPGSLRETAPLPAPGHQSC